MQSIGQAAKATVNISWPQSLLWPLGCIWEWHLLDICGSPIASRNYSPPGDPEVPGTAETCWGEVEQPLTPLRGAHQVREGAATGMNELLLVKLYCFACAGCSHVNTASTRVYSWTTYPTHLSVHCQIDSACIFAYGSTSFVADHNYHVRFQKGGATKPIIGSSWNNGIKNRLTCIRYRNVLVWFHWLWHL